MEEETDDLENIVAGLLHVEGEGVAAVPDLDEGETLKEVLDGQEGRTQHLPPRTWCVDKSRGFQDWPSIY